MFLGEQRIGMTSSHTVFFSPRGPKEGVLRILLRPQTERSMELVFLLFFPISDGPSCSVCTWVDT